jgi:opacity protein-like surface antigen
MKRVVLFSLLTMLVLASSSAYAQQRYPLGFGNLALKVDYFSFTEDAFEDVDLEDGIYIGVEGYMPLLYPNLYVGLETGWAGSENEGDLFIRGRESDYDLDATLVPIELNAKYAFEINPNLVLDLGAGISVNYFDLELDVEDSPADGDADDWVFGGQFFADINYKLYNNWFLGANIKYQITDDLELDTDDGEIDTDVSADNFRVGAHVGLLF